jgi:hypothetical protein
MVECATDGAAFSNVPAVCLTRTTTVSRSSSDMFQNSVTWWQSEREFQSPGFVISLDFCHSASVKDTSLLTQSRMRMSSVCFLISETFRDSPDFLASQVSLESGGDSNMALKVEIVVRMIVRGLVMISVIILLIVFLCRSRICVQAVSSESSDLSTSRSIVTPLVESSIEEPETGATNSGN